MKSRVTERGQITIPKELRDRLGIRAGQVVDFAEEGGRLVVTRRVGGDPVEAVYGILSLDRSTDELMAALRAGRVPRA
ncbi:MAG: AbrB/MazE/SpoVT family DNA-binding domain-containing protein [Longimicrobiales bacterium]|nr:AbrB/MazE/SpoVT family DNA-binding domain-containing protein [Longimicrobiales bacterium]